VVNAAGVIMDPKYKDTWHRRQSRYGSSLANLMAAFENYTVVLARNMLQTFTQSFDFVHDNIG
jgi:GPCR-Autoproteolysis INducing (GAIN) domain